MFCVSLCNCICQSGLAQLLFHFDDTEIEYGALPSEGTRAHGDTIGVGETTSCPITGGYDDGGTQAT